MHIGLTPHPPPPTPTPPLVRRGADRPGPVLPGRQGNGAAGAAGVWGGGMRVGGVAVGQGVFLCSSGAYRVVGGKRLLSVLLSTPSGSAFSPLAPSHTRIQPFRCCSPRLQRPWPERAPVPVPVPVYSCACGLRSSRGRTAGGTCCSGRGRSHILCRPSRPGHTLSSRPCPAPARAAAACLLKGRACIHPCACDRIRVDCCCKSHTAYPLHVSFGTACKQCTVVSKR